MDEIGWKWLRGGELRNMKFIFSICDWEIREGGFGG
jgi:hypothetical protein